MSCLVAVLIVGCGGKATTQTPSSSPHSAVVASPTTTAPASEVARSTVISSGNFVSGEHPTQGTVEIVNQNGKQILQLN